MKRSYRRWGGAAHYGYSDRRENSSGTDGENFARPVTISQIGDAERALVCMRWDVFFAMKNLRQSRRGYS